jgi:hypothetical protein
MGQFVYWASTIVQRKRKSLLDELFLLFGLNYSLFIFFLIHIHRIHYIYKNLIKIMGIQLNIYPQIQVGAPLVLTVCNISF